MTTRLRQVRCSHTLPTFHLALAGDQGVLVYGPISRENVCHGKAFRAMVTHRASWAEPGGDSRRGTLVYRTCPGYILGQEGEARITELRA